MSSSRGWAREREVVLLAVQRASILTRQVYVNTAAKAMALEKDDHSPVTVGDYGAQALIISALRHNFPADRIIAEEEAGGLRDKESLLERIWQYVRHTRLETDEEEKLLGGPIQSVESMIDCIDAGNKEQGAGKGEVGEGRIWTIDPIDGTKGFLRGGQYAIAVALIVGGQVQVGVLACPNLPIDDSIRLHAGIGHDQSSGEGKGVILSAVLGQGADSRPLANGRLESAKPIHMRAIDHVEQAIFCESVEAAHSNHSHQSAIADKLGISQQSVRMDSQAKYAAIARASADIYLRLPVSQTYREKIWDHAAGDIIVREAGCTVTDMQGSRLDFTAGSTLANNKGVVAAPSGLHAQVLAAVQSVLNAET